MTPAPIDFRACHHLGMANIAAWAPRLLGKRMVYYAPASVAWWPSPADGVHGFDCGPRLAWLGDWTGRWRIGETWGCDVVELLARLRSIRQGQAAALLCRTIGVPDLPRLPRQAARRIAA